MRKYLKVWWIFAGNTIQIQMAVRSALIVFLIGKFLRFGVFTFFIIILLNRTDALAGYTLNETLFFFLTFNLIDVLGQLFFREVYRFRQAVVSGSFDFYLTKPINALFRSLAAGPDILDFITLIPLLGAVAYFTQRLGISNFESLSVYILLVGVGFLISLSFHILVLSLAVITTEIDHAILMYRDVVGMGRFPIDIYREPIRGLLTFVIPVGLMMSFPVKAAMGLLSPALIVYAVLFSLLLLFVSFKIWNYALKQYSSASS